MSRLTLSAARSPAEPFHPSTHETIDATVQHLEATMIAAAVLATTLLQPANETTWWRTEGAEVSQESNLNVCALFVFRQEKAVGFLWDKDALTGIMFLNEKWNFKPSETRAAVRIGDHWISETADIDWFQATEQRNTMMVPIRYYPVESLLRRADSVSLRGQDGDFDVPLDRGKMPRLLDAVTTCRQHLT
jgi:hypothetical protein